MILTKEVKTDLENLKRYLEEKLGEPEYSDKVMRRLSAKILSLDTFPYRGKCTDLEEGNEQIRKIVFDKEVIYYYIDEGKKRVYIILIADSKQQQELLFKKRFEK